MTRPSPRNGIAKRPHKASLKPSTRSRSATPTAQALRRTPVEACKWITLAAVHGLKEAAIFKVALEKKLTPDQRSRAQQLANAALKRQTPN